MFTQQGRVDHLSDRSQVPVLAYRLERVAWELAFLRALLVELREKVVGPRTWTPDAGQESVAAPLEAATRSDDPSLETGASASPARARAHHDAHPTAGQRAGTETPVSPDAPSADDDFLRAYV